ncbi:Uncharacterised protein [Mycolicibacterium vanbaalenii]|uniref:Uncharacterized protein n=1 Tax=Mycolicibacterium vanbaalenii TaxID=110539 RepID=A0A5S9R983_MYCVN|nr:Uncharacterised protein [Mycolicibacterium vanbaalenii]
MLARAVAALSAIPASAESMAGRFRSSPPLPMPTPAAGPSSRPRTEVGPAGFGVLRFGGDTAGPGVMGRSVLIAGTEGGRLSRNSWLARRALSIMLAWLMNTCANVTAAPASVPNAIPTGPATWNPAAAPPPNVSSADVPLDGWVPSVGWVMIPPAAPATPSIPSFPRTPPPPFFPSLPSIPPSAVDTPPRAPNRPVNAPIVFHARNPTVMASMPPGRLLTTSRSPVSAGSSTAVHCFDASYTSRRTGPSSRSTPAH